MNNKNLLIGIIVVLFGCSPQSKIIQQESPAPERIPLLVIGNEEIDSDEFLYLFSKNYKVDAPSELLTPEEFEENLALFVHYKLKVKEAENLGLANSEEFEREFEIFKQDLIKPYLIKNSLQEGELLKAYNRMQEVVNASHILLQFPTNASKEDTIAVFRMAQKLKTDAEAGADFNTLASEYSEDPSAKDNRGNLGYFTALQMVHQFEDAAYNLTIGQISDPVLTDFGYHIIKLEDKKPNPGEIRVSHILVRSQIGDPVSEERALRKVGQIYSELQKSESVWEEVCAQFSEDISTKNTGGKLPWISLGSVIPEFERVAFTLTEEGEISPPVKTPYGFHIIRLEEKRPLASFEEMEPMIKSRVLRDSRSGLISSQVLAIQKSRYGFKENEPTYLLLKNAIEKDGIAAALENLRADNLLEQELFAVNSISFPVNAFFDHITQQENRVISGRPKIGFDSLYESFLSSTMNRLEEEDLESNNEEYKMLLKEYREGILLFSLMNEQVWQKALEDSVGLQQFFEKNQTNYYWKDRVNALIITMSKTDMTNAVRRFLSDKIYKKDLADRLENTFLLNDPLAFTMEEGIFEIDSNPQMKQLDLSKAFHESRQNGKVQFIITGQTIPASPKLLQETRGKAIQDYQEYLDQMLINSLKEKYTFSINPDEKNKLFEKIVGNQ
jgi:peptidyl-prolyl cis-trans isomerase SurA